MKVSPPIADQMYTDGVLARSWSQFFQKISDVINTEKDTYVDISTKGIVFKTSDGHYWRLALDTSGAVVTTDLGTTRP